MKLLPTNARNMFGPLRTRAPLFFAQHVWLIFLAGAVVALAVGIAAFYFEAYAVARHTYEAELSATRVDTNLFERALEFIAQDKAPRGSVPSDNPFAP